MPQPSHTIPVNTADFPASPTERALAHYEHELDIARRDDTAAFDRRMTLLRDAEADIALEQQADAEQRER